MKNLAIKFALHSSVFIFSILRIEEFKNSTEIISKSDVDILPLFKMIFQKIDVANICIFVFCLFLVNYFLIVESVYIMNKRPSIEEEIQKEKEQAENKNMDSGFIANNFLVKTVDKGLKVALNFWKSMLIDPPSGLQNNPHQANEETVDILPLNFLDLGRIQIPESNNNTRSQIARPPDDKDIKIKEEVNGNIEYTFD